MCVTEGVSKPQRIAVGPPPPSTVIPALSRWGMSVVTFAMLAAATEILARRECFLRPLDE